MDSPDKDAREARREQIVTVGTHVATRLLLQKSGGYADAGVHFNKLVPPFRVTGPLDSLTSFTLLRLILSLPSLG